MSLETSIVQLRRVPDLKAFDRIHNLVVIGTAASESELWKLLPGGDEVRRRRVRTFRDAPEEKSLFAVNLPNRALTRMAYAAVDPATPAFELLTLARRLVAAALDARARELTVMVHGFDDPVGARMAEAVLSAALARSVHLPTMKSEESVPVTLERVRVAGIDTRLDTTRLMAEAEGNGLARELTVMAPNVLTPRNYRERVARLAKDEGWTFEFLDTASLRRRNAGAFLAVVQGSAVNDAGIVHLRYRPGRDAGRPRVAFVGKGICFDTGGVNLKSARHMFGMNEDMEGSAVALGSFLALARMKVKFPMDCWLALAQNHVGPAAYKPNDIVTASDGTTIEIVHTDAEGRMVLADTLVLASRARPRLIIDFATLTGACIYSLGKGYSGVFTNQDGWSEALIAAGRDSGERIWPFPMDADYDKALESAVADVRQCSLDGDADHILAARFLRRFVKHDVPWIHLDLSAGNHRGGLAHVPTDATGFGVRLACHLLLDRDDFGV